MCGGVTSSDWCRHRILSAESLSRPESLGLVKVMFSLRDLYLEKDVTEAVSALQVELFKLFEIT